MHAQAHTHYNGAVQYLALTKDAVSSRHPHRIDQVL